MDTNRSIGRVDFEKYHRRRQQKIPGNTLTLLDEDPATDKQWNYIFHLCDELDMDYPDENLTKEQASNMITKLKTRLYDDDDNQY